MSNDTKDELRTLRQIADDLSKTMQCCCDFDNWEPLSDTGHSYVCRIRQTALAIYRQERKLG